MITGRTLLISDAKDFFAASVYICHVAQSFSQVVVYNKISLLAVVVPQLRKDGMYYEVNIKGYPRFYMTWSQLGRYDEQDGGGLGIPYQLLLAVSDMLEGHLKK